MVKTEKQVVGDIGEKIAGRFLVSLGYKIVGWNYRKPWGEIDVIVKKNSVLHFVEVKTVSRVTSSWKQKETVTLKQKLQNLLNVKENQKYTLVERGSEEKGSNVDEFRPEDNLHPWKLKRLKRAIQSYLAEKRISEEDDWVFDAVTVRLDSVNYVAVIEYLEDIILE